MRADLKDVIVNTSRHKDGEKRKNSLIGFREEQIDALPEKQGMRRNHTGWRFEFGDRLNPLRSFLKQNVGRPWDDVWSDVCRHNDARNVRGRHLREHVKQYVTGAGGQEGLGRWYRRNDFYVDDAGILQHDDDRRRYRYRPKYDADKCKIGDNLYERVNGCWFQIWYEKVEKSRQVFNYLLNRKEVEYYSEEVRVRQKQLSKKELRLLGLSNDPNFKWWEERDEFDSE